MHCAGCEHDPVRHGGVLPVPAVRRGLRRVRGQRALHRHPQRGAQVSCDWSDGQSVSVLTSDWSR